MGRFIEVHSYEGELVTMFQSLPLGKPLDIDLAPARDVVYSGVCLKHNRYLCILANYDSRARAFDRYSVVRTREISQFRPWTVQEQLRVRSSVLPASLSQQDIVAMNSFYSALKRAAQIGLIAFYEPGDDDAYFVGRLISLDRTRAKFRLVDVDGVWTRRVATRLSELTHFSFDTKYERRLERKTT